MQTTLEVEQAKELKRHQRDTLSSLVREQVINSLGSPGDLLRVQVQPLWGTKYRVNVFVGLNAACARVSHSYFLVTDADGNILESTPKIMRLY